MKSLLRSAWWTLGVFVVVFALSFSFWTGCGRDQGSLSEPQTAQQQITFDKVHPGMQSAVAVQERHTRSLMEKPGVVGTGIGLGKDGKPVILILTKGEGVKDLPVAIEGIWTRVDIVGEVRAMGYTKTYRPVPGGVSVGNANECAAGTIGCQVIIGGQQYALSNNHVFARENDATLGERINQPGRYDAKPRCAQTGQIGTLADFAPIVFSTSANNTIDAAVAAYSSGIATTCSMVDNLYTPSSMVVSPSVGLAVKKVGRTSALTTGTIAGINVTVNVQYSSGVARFVNQIYVASRFIRSGDSGSLMVTQSGNNPVGLCFAGGSNSAFANPISNVLQFFNATVCSN